MLNVVAVSLDFVFVSLGEKKNKLVSKINDFQYTYTQHR
jgi:hypothetical protein